MKIVPYAATAAVVLLAAGCAEMQWSRPGADAALVARDQDECRAQALQRAIPSVAARGTPDARTSMPGTPPQGQGSSDRFVAEHEEMRRCMLQRGYELKPAG